ncbi:MAG: ankyrin repeat domain-containing protein [Actinomycetota bacterium]|nr:ankyrin repeat domain-containing protein [Actinomycetota bacterium]
MPHLPARADLDQLRSRAKELLQAAQRGDPEATARLRTVSDRLALSAAQLVIAREYGFASWAELKTEIERRAILDSGDLARLAILLAEHPELAVRRMVHWCDHPRGASPLGYVAMMRFDTSRGVWRDVPGTGAMARALLDAGAPVEGDDMDAETPLMTAASYGDAEVARILIEAGADLHATAATSAGGVPGGTALRHAAVFGLTDVVEVLLAAGATDLVAAAAAGDLAGALTPHTSQQDRIAALRTAAAHGRLDVIDQLIAASTPVDGVDRDGSTALHEAAFSGRADSVRHLLAHGADPAPATPGSKARLWDGAGTSASRRVPDTATTKSRRSLTRSPQARDGPATDEKSRGTNGQLDTLTAPDRPRALGVDADVDVTQHSPLPLACKLGPGYGRSRLLRWQRLHEAAGPVAHLDGLRLEVRYQPATGIRAELAELAAAEPTCCSFATWSVSQVEGRPVLHVVPPTDRPEAVAPSAALFGAGSTA